MSTNANKDLILNTVVVIGAWLIVITAAVDENLEGTAAVVPIDYRVE